MTTGFSRRCTRQLFSALLKMAAASALTPLLHKQRLPAKHVHAYWALDDDNARMGARRDKFPSPSANLASLMKLRSRSHAWS
jgi:hypothetical protein